MHITDLDFLAAEERYKGLLREAELERLIQAAGIGPGIAGRLYRVAADWFSTQIVHLGCALARPSTASACQLQAA
jgi:hypothetical protein